MSLSNRFLCVQATLNLWYPLSQIQNCLKWRNNNLDFVLLFQNVAIFSSNIDLFVSEEWYTCQEKLKKKAVWLLEGFCTTKKKLQNKNLKRQLSHIALRSATKQFIGRRTICLKGKYNFWGFYKSYITL